MALTARSRAPKTMAIATANDAFSVEVGQGAADLRDHPRLQRRLQQQVSRPTRPTCRRSSAVSRRSTPTSSSTAGISTKRCCCSARSRSRTSTRRSYGYSVGPDTPDFRKTLGKDANWVFGGTQWSPTAKYKGAPRLHHATRKSTPRQFDKKYGHIPDYHNAESTAACLAFQYAIEKAGSLDPQKVRDALAALDVVTFYGILKFDSRGINVYKPMAVNQIQNGDLMTVWPLGVAERETDVPDPALERALKD